jgi:hypothetical protein
LRAAAASELSDCNGDLTGRPKSAEELIAYSAPQIADRT